MFDQVCDICFRSMIDEMKHFTEVKGSFQIYNRLKY